MRTLISGAKVHQNDRILHFRQSFYRRNAFEPWSPKYSGTYHNVYIGTWSKTEALGIAEELKSDGFSVRLYNRGCRRLPPENAPRTYAYGREITRSLASHIAIYISGKVSHITGNRHA